MKNQCPFPERVEFKSCTATIYHQLRRGAERFEVRCYDVDGLMQRLTFPTYSSAKKFAETAVKEIAGNREHFITLRGRHAFDYQMALETLSPLSLSLAQAATLVADNHRQLDGKATLCEAVKYFLENRPQKSPDITVREVVDQLLALKEKEGEVGRYIAWKERSIAHAKEIHCRRSIDPLASDYGQPRMKSWRHVWAALPRQFPPAAEPR
jgi:hypothetical protein